MVSDSTDLPFPNPNPMLVGIRECFKFRSGELFVPSKKNIQKTVHLHDGVWNEYFNFTLWGVTIFVIQKPSGLEPVPHGHFKKMHFPTIPGLTFMKPTQIANIIFGNGQIGKEKELFCFNFKMEQI